MKVNKGRLPIILLACCCCALLMPAMASSQQPVTVSEAMLRKLASKTVTPGYPERAKKRGTKGIAVVRVDVDEKGELSDIRIVEAPDIDIEASVTDAVRQWKFGPAQDANGAPLRIRGKLTFYFVSDHGQFRVENPRQFGNQ
ncbi:MAG TPA: energy transducer TonB [Pyrinomonadaceae bacterium]|nr:energy transducer TonB [Pyrinomonadaceae bacterium]